MKRARAVLLAAILFPIVTGAARRPSPRVAFPSNRPRVVSPDGRFALINDDSDSEPHHKLFLEDRRTKSRRKILEYGRHVDVLWNPKSTSFVVNDYVGSNFSECLLFSTIADEPPVDVGDEVQHRITSSKQLTSIRQNDHVYFAGQRWLSSRTLQVKVWGHGDIDPSGFTRFYNYYVPSGKQQLPK